MSDLAERYKICGRCIHDEESADTAGSTCYLCRRNPTDHRIDYFKDNEGKLTKCNRCKGSGWMPYGPGVRGIKICPDCHGAGIISLETATFGKENL